MIDYLLSKYVTYVEFQSKLDGLSDSEFREDVRRFTSDFSLFLSWIHQYYDGFSVVEDSTK